MELIIGFSILLAAIHAMGEGISYQFQKYRQEVLSLSAGLFLSFVFLELLERLAISFNNGNQYVYLFLLLGFSCFHVLNKYVYLHTHDKKERHKELEELHFAGFFLDVFFSGLAGALFLKGFDLQVALVAIVPFVLHNVSVTFSFTHLYAKYRMGTSQRAAFSLAPIMGAVASQVIRTDGALFYYGLAFSAGAVLYLATRHMIPSGTKGRISWYAAGVIIGAILLEFVT